MAVVMAKEKDPQLLALGLRIKAHRHAAGLSQEALGELTGMHRVSINRIENGGHDISFTTLVAFADALNVTVQELTGDQLPPPTPPGPPGRPMGKRK